MQIRNAARVGPSHGQTLHALNFGGVRSSGSVVPEICELTDRQTHWPQFSTVLPWWVGNHNRITELARHCDVVWSCCRSVGRTSEAGSDRAECEQQVSAAGERRGDGRPLRHARRSRPVLLLRRLHETAHGVCHELTFVRSCDRPH